MTRRSVLAGTAIATTLLCGPMAEATEPNLRAIDQYAGRKPHQTALHEQVSSLNQFGDVQPSDWAYQALSTLVERYGCLAGSANAGFKGHQSLSRYEAAALLNACLHRVTETTDALKRLTKEFATELAVLKGRADGLEAKVGELEATQFSTTTKLDGRAVFVIGTNTFGGSARENISAARGLEGGTSVRRHRKLSQRRHEN